MKKTLTVLALCISWNVFADESFTCNKVEQILSHWYSTSTEKISAMEKMKAECASWGGVIRPNSDKRIGSSNGSILLGVICQLPKSGTDECKNVAQILSGIYYYPSEKASQLEEMQNECSSWGGTIKANSLKVTASHRGYTWLGAICELPQ